jgi:hypothetical protein
VITNLPIERKLTLLILATCTGALLIASALLTAFDIVDQRASLARNMTLLADIVGENTQASLTFADDVSARATLGSLQAEEDVLIACLYDQGGALFAGYERRGGDAICDDTTGVAQYLKHFTPKFPLMSTTSFRSMLNHAFKYR